MPFNKVKCPKCLGEKHTLQQDENNPNFKYVCDSCGHVFEVSIDEIIKKL